MIFSSNCDHEIQASGLLLLANLVRNDHSSKLVCDKYSIRLMTILRELIQRRGEGYHLILHSILGLFKNLSISSENKLKLLQLDLLDLLEQSKILQIKEEDDSNKILPQSLITGAIGICKNLSREKESLNYFLKNKKLLFSIKNFALKQIDPDTIKENGNGEQMEAARCLIQVLANYQQQQQKEEENFMNKEEIQKICQILQESKHPKLMEEANIIQNQ